MPASGSKRKRERSDDASKITTAKSKKQATVTNSSPKPATSGDVCIQIVAGSYNRVLHGTIATIPRSLIQPASNTKKQSAAKDSGKVEFADTFLFNAHSSAIRCLALSPASDSDSPSSQKVILASGSSDERINLYQLSTSPPPPCTGPSLPTLVGSTISQNSKNRELGSLMHHSSSISALYFPTRSKLLSAAEDNTIAVSRVRDWTVLSTIKAPIPKPFGRPSGDTAAPGEVPAGVNDFAVHPSFKLMVSVSKGERCMRLWNLMTGKKAGVLNFDKDMLEQVGEGRWGKGEGQRVKWNPEGEEFVVVFERGAVVYSMNSKPKARILPTPLTRLIQLRYLETSEEEEDVIAVSTEDGRILFYSNQAEAEVAENLPKSNGKGSKSETLPSCKFLGQLGGKAAAPSKEEDHQFAIRIKDFDFVKPSEDPQSKDLLCVAGSSDGAIRVWHLSRDELKPTQAESDEKTANGARPTNQVGELLGQYQTGNRITCLATFAMTGEPGSQVSNGNGATENEASSSSSEDGDE